MELRKSYACDATMASRTDTGPGKSFVDNVEFGHVNRQSKRLDLGDKIIQAVVVDLILALDGALQSDPMQRHAPRAQVAHERQQRLSPCRELFADALDVVLVDHQLGGGIGLVSQAKCRVDVFDAKVLQPD